MLFLLSSISVNRLLKTWEIHNDSYILTFAKEAVSEPPVQPPAKPPIVRRVRCCLLQGLASLEAERSAGGSTE